MTSRRLVAQGLACTLVALISACGNYSNEDLDFQLALPQQEEIQAKLQVSLVRRDSAEYYMATRSAVLTFNAMIVDLTSFVDHVRGYPPTSRNGNQRTWGPFPSDKYPTWEIRVVMTRSAVSPTLLHMDYQVDVRPVGQDDTAWVSLLAGSYDSRGSARTGQGQIHFFAQAVRQAGYPIDDDRNLVDLDHLDVTYANAAYPKSVTMTIVNLDTAKTKSGHYAYAQAQDGSGSMTFDWHGLSDAGVLVAATMTSRWQGAGPGRADLVLEPATLALTLGTDCWGADTVATYSYRVQGNVTPGDPLSCVF